MAGIGYKLIGYIFVKIIVTSNFYSLTWIKEKIFKLNPYMKIKTKIKI